MRVSNWNDLTTEEKRRKLFDKKRATLYIFLERGAISKQQYEKSLGDMREKMGLDE